MNHPSDLPCSYHPDRLQSLYSSQVHLVFVPLFLFDLLNFDFLLKTEEKNRKLYFFLCLFRCFLRSYIITRCVLIIWIYLRLALFR